MRTFPRLLNLIAACAALLMTSVVPASAAPVTPAPSTGVPADLLPFVAGTDEFAKSAWMTGACKDQGGDVGAYINAVAPDMGRLLYWSASPEEKASLWAYAVVSSQGSLTLPTDTAQAEPPAQFLPPGPGPGGSWIMVPYPQTCAAQLKQWTDPGAGVFGFSWAASMDVASVTQVLAKYGGDVDLDTFETLIKGPCGVEGSEIYCATAFYANCPANNAACAAWNMTTAHNYLLMYQFADLNTSIFDDIGSFFQGIGEGIWGGGEAVVSAFAAVFGFIVDVAQFITDPEGAFEKFVNVVRDAATGLVTVVLDGFNTVSTWDVGAGGFLARYAAAAALGWLVLALMFFGAIRRAWESGDRDSLGKVMRRLVESAVMISFAPAFFHVLVQVASVLTEGLTQNFTGPASGDMIAKLGFFTTITSKMLPGGIFIGLLLFLLMVVGAFALFLGLMVQRFGMEMGATGAALVAGLWIHDKWKPRVRKIMHLVIGLILAKPLTYLALGIVFGIVSDNLGKVDLTDPFKALSALTMATIGILFAGLAPFALMKWLPVSPSSGEPAGGGGNMMSGAVIGAGATLLSGGAGKGAAMAARGASTSTQGAGRSAGGTTAGGSGSTGRIESAYQATQTAAKASGGDGAVGQAVDGSPDLPGAASTAGSSRSTSPSTPAAPGTSADGHTAGAGLRAAAHTASAGESGTTGGTSSPQGPVIGAGSHVGSSTTTHGGSPAHRASQAPVIGAGSATGMDRKSPPAAAATSTSPAGSSATSPSPAGGVKDPAGTPDQAGPPAIERPIRNAALGAALTQIGQAAAHKVTHAARNHVPESDRGEEQD